MPASVHHGDWLELAHSLAPASIDFLYSDPPFNTGKVHRTPPGAEKRTTSRRGGSVPDGASLEPATFTDRFDSTADYIRWLQERLAATVPALKRSAIVAIHCDFRTSHHVRLMLDDMFTPEHFVNHLIWHYGLGGSSPRRFARKHDDILAYCVDPEMYYFEAPLVPATSQRLKGKMKKATDVIRSPSGLPEGASASSPTDEESEHSGLPDSLLDIPSLNNMSRERTGYPTQKPLALLEMLVRAFCPVGGMVLDPTCGSGTTLVAAVTAGRSAIGFDASADAVKTARERLAGARGTEQEGWTTLT